MSEREDTFLIAVTVTGDTSRMAARERVCQLMPKGTWGQTRESDGVVVSWHDATVDYTENHDNGEAVWAHPGRGIEAQHALVVAGLAPEEDDRIGAHPQVHVIRDGGHDGGHVLAFECVRCNNDSDHPAVLAEVPCIDLSKWEHGHYWTGMSVDHHGIVTVECIADCGMTIVNGQAVGEVSDEHAGSPPESEHDYGYYPEN